MSGLHKPLKNTMKQRMGVKDEMCAERHAGEALPPPSLAKQSTTWSSIFGSYCAAACGFALTFGIKNKTVGVLPRNPGARMACSARTLDILDGRAAQKFYHCKSISLDLVSASLLKVLK